MKYMSFGPDAGHLMERLLKEAAVDEVDNDTVLIQPEADPAALALLREAAEGHWVVELLTKLADEPDNGEGIVMTIQQARDGEIAGETLHWESAVPDGNYLRVGLQAVEKVHIY